MFMGSRSRLAGKADNLTAINKPFVSLDNVGSLTSHNPIGLHGSFGFWRLVMVMAGKFLL
jgi:hypothetical protein